MRSSLKLLLGFVFIFTKCQIECKLDTKNAKIKYGFHFNKSFRALFVVLQIKNTNLHSFLYFLFCFVLLHFIQILKQNQILYQLIGIVYSKIPINIYISVLKSNL